MEHDALYPVADDKPMTTSFIHCEAFIHALAATRDHLRDVDCLVAEDFAICHKRLSAGTSEPGFSMVPNPLVAFGDTLDRDASYCLREVGKTPEFGHGDNVPIHPGH